MADEANNGRNNNDPPGVQDVVLPQERTIGDYSTSQIRGNRSAIIMPPQAQNLDIKPGMYHMVQSNNFWGRMGENPYSHIDNFDGICDTFINLGGNEDQVKPQFFPLSLTNDANVWFKGLQPNSITTWE